jgi:hypothetical protein
MAIKSSRPGGTPPTPSDSRPMGTKGTSGVSYGHRGFPAENQGLLARMDAEKDAVSGDEYNEMLHRAKNSGNLDAGADWAQDEFERRHDRRQGVVQTHEYEGGPRIDSLNFPADKYW